ncbi:alkylation response protein AidB-like acyl-CoA dehydrogenase [Brevibacterium sanguinis]|uniref:Alkylation response protein AidB-like acyl-CoA dehydrogenase n=2 Tax=Brevibacterium TaxID=1696 RepID=A0A366IHK7_9MICO|nr:MULTISPECIES: acyl-CoA dehydrogenase family protein [Brevibacterium]RBP65079.1 alkylation response protein AidB-like acyl-CoA dehydrogenase [Brevibacterium sanguinis]RBP71342.1 alkylation response protein AidB-like acyl-CoA dehydrogenase [Brevibacterium celere]
MTDREARHAHLAQQYLPTEVLDRFRDRAAVYDRENRFFDEDLEELRAMGYLQLFVPSSHGGPGLSLHEVSRLQQRLASAAPATALAINMHLMCTGVVKALNDRGDDSLNWVLDDVMAGEIFAFGISEPSNDWVLQGSTTVAEPGDDGGWLLTGVKIFTSLSPVWTRLIVHGLVAGSDTGDEPGELIYGFIDRDAPGITVSDRWDVLGMRASQSRATILDSVPMRPERVSRLIPAGRHPDLLTFAITSNFQLLIASVYAGVAARALELGAQGLRRRKSAKSGTTFAEVPESRARLADAHLDYLGVPAMLDAYTRDFDELVDHGAGWPLRLVGARIKASEAARRAAETALMCTGGSGFDSSHELSRLHRDATAGLFHPPSVDAARPMYAAALLDD